MKSTWLNSGKQNRIIIFGDSIFRGIRFRKFNNEIKNGYAKFKTFPGADSREILHYFMELGRCILANNVIDRIKIWLGESLTGGESFPVEGMSKF